MKKVNRMIAIMLSVLLLAAAFCMTACKDDKKNPNTPTTTTKPNPGNDTRKNPNTTTDPRTLVVETNWGLAADTVVMTLNFKGSEYKLTAGELMLSVPKMFPHSTRPTHSSGEAPLTSSTE